MTLDRIGPGDKAKIKKITAKGQLGQRLVSLGFFPGCEVEIIRNAPLVDPVEIRLDGHMLSIRHNEAACIEVIPV
ncbi:MAG: FeoA domain-containing protein [Thermodesulfobacteriota bacterium]|nr:FeoA domain-containing protein [Thermodesulfobacteriota bacterium]